MNFGALRVAVRDAARTAFTEVHTSHPEEQFYTFALYTDEGAMTVMPSCNSEEGFQKATGGSNSEANYYRWATGEWAYEAVGAEAFQPVYEMLNVKNRYAGENGNGDNASEGDAAFAAFLNQLIKTMTDALSDLDREGFFGKGAEREAVTLFVSISDSDDSIEVENESARRLNPASTYERFATRFS